MFDNTLDGLNKCNREGCHPVLQSRGQMKPEDHHAQFARYHAVATLMEVHGVYMDLGRFYAAAHDVENDAENAHDVRVSCSKCGKATSWMRRDIEEYRRHGDGDYRRYTVVRDGNMESVSKQWNDGVKPNGDS